MLNLFLSLYLDKSTSLTFLPIFSQIHKTILGNMHVPHNWRLWGHLMVSNRGEVAILRQTEAAAPWCVENSVTIYIYLVVEASVKGKYYLRNL